MPVKVIAELLVDGDAALLARCCAEFLGLDDPNETEEVYARPLGRFGYTNSRLYRVFFQPERRGLAFVVKTDLPEQMSRERDGCMRVRASFPGAAEVHPYPRGAGECEALIYRLIAHGGERAEGSDVVELKDIVYRTDASAELPASVQIVERLYDHLAQGHKGSSQGIVFGPEYQWYLRERSSNPRLLDPLTDIFGRDDTAEVTFDGLTLVNPRRVLANVKALQRECLVTAVHGDLHPNNVLINENADPAVIDFAFGQRRAHWAKDFVLMESSLRFLLQPRLLRPDVVAQVDDLLMSEYGPEAVLEIATKVGGHTGEVLQEMARLVATVRRKCRECCPDYDFAEYLIAQYLIMMGSLRLPAYQHMRSLRACCRLADFLERIV